MRALDYRNMIDCRGLVVVIKRPAMVAVGKSHKERIWGSYYYFSRLRAHTGQTRALNKSCLSEAICFLCNLLGFGLWWSVSSAIIESYYRKPL